MKREQAIEIARSCAKAKPQSYYAEPFQPHEWVIDAMLLAVRLYGAQSVPEPQSALIETLEGLEREWRELAAQRRKWIDELPRDCRATEHSWLLDAIRLEQCADELAEVIERVR